MNHSIILLIHILSSALLFGTGLGTAFHGWSAQREPQCHHGGQPQRGPGRLAVHRARRDDPARIRHLAGPEGRVFICHWMAGSGHGALRVRGGVLVTGRLATDPDASSGQRRIADRNGASDKIPPICTCLVRAGVASIRQCDGNLLSYGRKAGFMVTKLSVAVEKWAEAHFLSRQRGVHDRSAREDVDV